jgi:hypothetical protein
MVGTPARLASPFHGVIDGAGAHPRRRRFQGSAYMLATRTVRAPISRSAARDLYLNNTSWVPTGVPCTISRSLSPRYANRASISISASMRSMASP